MELQKATIFFESLTVLMFVQVHSITFRWKCLPCMLGNYQEKLLLPTGRERVEKMQRNTMWLPLIASIGVGAVTYYAISKNNHSVGQTFQKVMPYISQMSNNSGQLGPNGMS